MLVAEGFNHDLTKRVVPILLTLALVGVGIYALVISSIRINEGVQCDHPLSIMLILHEIIVVFYAGATFLSKKLEGDTLLRKFSHVIAMILALFLLVWIIIMV